MDNKDQPAFPIDSNDLKQVETGLTKREYIAAMAMQGLLSNQLFIQDVDFDFSVTAELSIKQADELLKQLSQ